MTHYNSLHMNTYVQPEFSGTITIPVHHGNMDWKSGDIVWDEKCSEKIQWCYQVNGIYIKKLNKIIKYDNDKGVYVDTYCVYDKNGSLIMIPPEVGGNTIHPCYVALLIKHE